MGRIVVTEYISVDGIVEAPSGTEPFERVGWTDDFSRGPEGDKFKLEETMASTRSFSGGSPTTASRRSGRSSKAGSPTSSTPCRSTSSRRP